MIEVKGKLEEDDYVRAVYMNMRPRPIFAIPGLIILSGFLFAVAYELFGPGDSMSTSTTLLVLIAFAWVMFYFLAFVPWRARKTFRQQKGLHREIRWRFGDSGLSWESQDGRGTSPWADIHKWKESERMFLLYLSDALFHMVPKRHFTSSADVESVRDLLSLHIGPAT